MMLSNLRSVPVPSREERPSAPIYLIDVWLAWKEKWSSSLAVGDSCEGLGEAIKNLGLWYCWVWIWLSFVCAFDSDGPSIWLGLSRFCSVLASFACFYFIWVDYLGMAIVESNLFRSAAFFSNSLLRSSRGCLCVRLKFSIFFSSSAVFSISAAYLLLRSFSRCSSSLWSHLHRF